MANEQQEEGLSFVQIVEDIHRFSIIVGNLAADILNPKPEHKELPNKEKG